LINSNQKVSREEGTIKQKSPYQNSPLTPKNQHPKKHPKEETPIKDNRDEKEKHLK
jgi:hypothetical protein